MTFAEESIDAPKKYNYVVFWADDGEGIRMYASQMNTSSTSFEKDPKYWIKRPCKAGTSWDGFVNSVSLKQKYVIPAKFRIVSTKEIAFVTAGEFRNCILVIGSGTSSDGKVEVENLTWYAPKVGFVKAVNTTKCKDPSIGLGGSTVVQLTSTE